MARDFKPAGISNRPGHRHGLAAGFVAGGEADEEFVGHGGAGGGEAGAGLEGARVGGEEGVEGVEGGGVVGVVIRAGDGAELVVLGFRIGAGFPFDLRLGLGGDPGGGHCHRGRGITERWLQPNAFKDWLG